MADKHICIFEGCSNPAKTRGFCHKHYQRLLYHNAIPEDAPRKAPPMSARDDFIAAALASDETSCINWPFARTLGRAFRFNPNGSNKVHVVICEKVHGPKPTPKHEVAHLCGKGHEGCINPRHLAWKTRKENAADMAIHGTVLFGERANGARFKEADILDMRKRWAGGETLTSISKDYEVRPNRVHSIVNRHTWKHLP